MSSKFSYWKMTVVVVIFIGFIGLFFWALSHDPRELPSQLINQPVPEFSVVDLLEPEVIHTQSMFNEKITLLNVWASWCAACYSEHPYWNQFTQTSQLQLVGLNYNDKKEKALRFLESQGNPYKKVIFDQSGRLGIDFGVYGAPETFLIGPDARVRYRHVGVVNSKVFATKFKPLINKIKQGF